MSSDTENLAEAVAGSVEIRDRGGGRFEILGELSFQTVATALEKSKAMFSKHSIIEIDLAGVTRADSAGLALMLEWVNRARNNAHDLRFTNIPAQIISIAQISEVEDMLYRAERWTGA
ncbi:MAG: STAS domain-containing protein [Gammaproteobacteria bacterium]